MTRNQLLECVRRLKAKGYVGYGRLVPCSVLEEVLGVEYADSWEWRGPLLELRTHLHDCGYFLSERGTDDGDIRFLSESEIPDHLHRRRLKRYRTMQTDLASAQRLPTSNLGDRNRKVLRHEQDRLSRDVARLAAVDEEFKEIFCE